VRRAAFVGLLPRPALLRGVVAGLRFYQRSGLQRFVRASGVLRLLPSSLAASEALLPTLPPAGRGGALPEVVPARGARRARVGFLHGCVQDAVFRTHNEATLRCLTRQGVEVVVPRAQRCCGALHAHAGEPETTRALARGTIAAFEAAEVEAVVVNVAGCGAHLKAYGHLLRQDPAWAERAAAFARRVVDATEYLARVPLVGPLGPLPLRATYHEPCHLAHGQRVRTAPRRLLQAIPGLELVELEEADLCCGSAGVYNLLEPGIASRLLARKLERIAATGATVVASGNPGCLLQLRVGLVQRGLPIRACHPVELLAWSLAGRMES
jgi:glycolate oxidase iron-sulfur subunit